MHTSQKNLQQKHCTKSCKIVQSMGVIIEGGTGFGGIQTVACVRPRSPTWKIGSGGDDCCWSHLYSVPPPPRTGAMLVTREVALRQFHIATSGHSVQAPHQHGQ